MKIKQYKFESGIKLFNIADVHRAHPNCDDDFLHQIIEMIKNDPNAYWVSTGDLGELALKDSKGDVYEAGSPQWELDVLTSELGPIADKCLGFVHSNHHVRVQKASGVNFDKVLATQLRVPYLGKTGVLAITLNRCTYYVALHHGVGGGTRGNKINRAKQFSNQYPGADVYLTGHVHTYDDFPVYQKYIDKKRISLNKVVAWHQIGGHFLHYEESYADEKMLEESPVCCGVVELSECAVGKNSVKKINCYAIWAK